MPDAPTTMAPHQPAYAEQIHDPWDQPIADAVVGAPMTPRTVVDRQFAEGPAVHHQQCREEVVVPMEERQLQEALTTYDACSTSGIGDPHAGHPVAETVGDARTGTSDPAVLPTGTETDGHVRAL